MRACACVGVCACECVRVFVRVRVCVCVCASVSEALRATDPTSTSVRSYVLASARLLVTVGLKFTSPNIDAIPAK